MPSGGVFDIAGKAARVAVLEAEVLDTGFWNDQQGAQKKMQELSGLRDMVDTWDNIVRRSHDALDLCEMAADDPGLLDELEAEAGEIERELDTREFDLALGGPYDRGSALFSIHAGAGGTEAQDGAQMLLRMYLRWAERRDFKTTIMDLMDGEEAGIKSATVLVAGPNAYGLLKAEKGIAPAPAGAGR